MKRIFSISIIVIINLSCAGNIYSQSLKSNFNIVSESDKKIVYLEYNNYPKGVSTLGLAKVTVFDLQNNKKSEFTDDKSFNRSPCFSNDGKCILFFSSRNVSPEIVEVLGSSAEYNLFKLNIKKNEIMLDQQLNKLNKNLELGHSINKIEQMNDSIFIVSTFSSIYSFNIKTSTLITIKMLNDKGDQSIYDFCAEQNNIAIRFHIRNITEPSDKIVLLNQESKKEIIISELYNLDIGNWSPDGKYFCYIDSVIKIYDVNNNLSKVVETNELKSKGIECEHAYFISNNELLLLGWEKDEITKLQRDDLFLINLDNNRISQLTNDGNMKEEISVFYKK